MGKKKRWDAERLQTLARIAVANGLVVFTTFYSNWTLREVTLAYAGELVILMLVVHARVLSARTLPGKWQGSRRGSWPLLLAKFYAISVTLPLYLLFAATTAIAVFGDFTNWNLSKATLHSLVFAWLVFLASHVLEFIATARTGAYVELISDARVMAPLWRWPVMIFAFVGAAAERQAGEQIMPWYFILILAFMAVANTSLQVTEMDAVRASVRPGGRPPSA